MSTLIFLRGDQFSNIENGAVGDLRHCCNLHRLRCGAFRLLSDAAAGVLEAELQQLEAAAAGFPLHLTDVAPDLAVHHFFRQWDGDYTVEAQDGTDTGI